MSQKYFLAIDEGTTSVRAVIFDEKLSAIGVKQIELPMMRPAQDCVELDAENIYQKTVEVCRGAVENAGIAAKDIICCGITTQRTSWVLWEKDSGKPACNMVTWLDARTKKYLAELKKNPEALAACGDDLLLARPYTSYVALRYVLDHDPALAQRVKNEELLFGTPDSFLLFRMTKERAHRVASSNASHTGIMRLTGEWNQEMMDYFDFPISMFPEVCPESFLYGHMDPEILGVEIPITGVVADQQAALFSQDCLEEGDVKCTNGTGTFVTLNIGHEPKVSTEAFYTRVAWTLGDQVTYMTEGHSATCGVCVEWMRDHMHWFKDHKQLEEMIFGVPDNHDVYFVPALQGMGTPYLNYGARGAFMGITGDTDAAHMARAVIEALAFAGANVCRSVQELHNVKMRQIKLSGGVSKNPLIGQYMANVLGVEAVVPDDMEASLLGAVEFAAIQIGFMKAEEIGAKFKVKKVYQPDERADACKAEFQRWLKAVDRVLDWLD